MSAVAVPGGVAEIGAAWHGVLTASAPSADADRFMSLRVTRVERAY